MNTTTSPTRRVLGEKDPNAPVQTQSPRKAQVGLENGYSSPAAISQRPSLKRPLSPASFSPHAGRKRKLEQTTNEDVIPESQSPSPSQSQDASASMSMSMPHPMSQMTDILSDSASEQGGGPYKQYKSTPNTVFSSSFRPSQEDPSQVVEAQFEIHEEPSQQTLDRMHAVTLPQNTSQLIPSLRPNLVKEASQVSLSMSSLIDFENNRSSQGDDDMQMIEQDDAAVKDQQRPKSQEESRKEMLLEKAETLRTRLQLALFKIQTNQISRPFARLQIPAAAARSPPSDDAPAAAFSSSSPHSSSTVRGGSRSPAVATLETRVAMARARATMDLKPKVRSLSSLPMPRIAPTAFSARWNDGDQAANIPSSPPLLPVEQQQQQPQSVERRPAAARMDHGLVAGRGEPRTPVRLSDTRSGAAIQHDGDDNDRGVNSTQRTQYRPGGPTSSVVKGEAANSLLELVRGGGGGGGGGTGPAWPGGVGMCGL